MACLDDLQRAKELLASARTLRAQGDTAGVAGLAYHAYELAARALALKVDGVDPGSHAARRRRAQALLTRHAAMMERLWQARQVNFYGNVHRGGRRQTLTEAEIDQCIQVVEEIINEIEDWVLS